MLGKTFELKRILLSLIGWESIGNSNWYIFVIILLYIFTYVSFSIFKNNRKLAVFGVVGFTLLYITLIKLSGLKETWWYDTSICYALGMIYSLYKDNIENILFKNNYNYFICLIVFVVFNGILELCVLKDVSLICNLLLMSLFSLLVVLVTMKVSFNNKMLNWCGSHLFEIYILQRIPMMVFEHINLNKNIYLFFALCLCVTILLAWVYKLLIDKTWKLIVKR